MRTLPLVALLFLLVLPAAQCDRRPGDCLADELGKRRATHSTWIDACANHLFWEATEDYGTCRTEWQDCHGYARTFESWREEPRNECCHDDIIMAADRACEVLEPIAETPQCKKAFDCDTQLDTCLRSIDLEWHPHYSE